MHKGLNKEDKRILELSCNGDIFIETREEEHKREGKRNKLHNCTVIYTIQREALHKQLRTWCIIPHSSESKQLLRGMLYCTQVSMHPICQML